MADTDDAILKPKHLGQLRLMAPAGHDANMDLRGRPTCRNPCAS